MNVNVYDAYAGFLAPEKISRLVYYELNRNFFPAHMVCGPEYWLNRYELKWHHKLKNLISNVRLCM